MHDIKKKLVDAYLTLLTSYELGTPLNYCNLKLFIDAADLNLLSINKYSEYVWRQRIF